MNLREQIKQIASEKINPEFANSVNWPRLLDYLAIKAFKENWPESIETRAIRYAHHVLDSKQMVTDDEPAVE